MKKLLILIGWCSVAISISSCTTESIENENFSINADDITPPTLPDIVPPDIDHGGKDKDKDNDGF